MVGYWADREISRKPDAITLKGKSIQLEDLWT